MSEGKFLNQINKQLQSLDDRLAGVGTSAVSVAANPNAGRSDTYTGTTTGVTVNTSASPLKSFAIQVTGTGAAASVWTVVLEGSIDGVNFSTILSHTDSDGDGVTKFTGASFYPAKYFRSRCSALTKGSATNIVVQILGL